MKRLFALMLVLAVILTAFSGCTAAKTEGISIVCTSYSVYDWLRNLCGDVEINIILLGANGSDIHSYQPTAADIMSVAEADMTVTVGGVSDAWVSDTVKSNGKKGAVAVSLMDEMRADLFLMGGEHSHEGDHADHEYDEHIWLSPEMAIKACNILRDKLCALDAANAEKYKANAEKYLAELKTLDGEYSAAINAAENKTVIFADRYPFRYLANSYGLVCHAAFEGCSADSDADFGTVTRLADQIKQNNIGAVLIIEGSNDALARSIIDASGRKDCKILTVDSMQSTTVEELALPEGYIAVMRKNLKVIKSALER